MISVLEELDSFCRKGYIPPIYDAYNASQQDPGELAEEAPSFCRTVTRTLRGVLHVAPPTFNYQNHHVGRFLL